MANLLKGMADEVFEFKGMVEFKGRYVLTEEIYQESPGVFVLGWEWTNKPASDEELASLEKLCDSTTLMKSIAETEGRPDYVPKFFRKSVVNDSP